MSFILKIKDHSVINGYPQLVTPKVQAFSYDAIISLFYELRASTDRLQKYLLGYSPDLSKRVQTDFEPSVAVTEIWNILTGIARIHKLMPLAGFQLGPISIARLSPVSNAVDALGALPEIISTHVDYLSARLSTLGDFWWRYRAAIDKDFTEIYCKTGVAVSAEYEFTFGGEHLVKNKLHKYDGQTGVFGLEFLFFNKVESSESNNQTGIEFVKVDIDDAIEILNDIILGSENNIGTFTKQALSSDGEAKLGYGRLESMISVFGSIYNDMPPEGNK